VRVLRTEPRWLLGGGLRLKIVGHGILENVNGAAGQHTRSRAADYEIHKGPARRNKGTRTREDAVSRKREKERRVAGRALKEKERERERGGEGRELDEEDHWHKEKGQAGRSCGVDTPLKHAETQNDAGQEAGRFWERYRAICAAQEIVDPSPGSRVYR